MLFWLYVPAVVQTYYLRNAKAVPLKPDDRYSLSSGEWIKLGALEVRVEYAPQVLCSVNLPRDVLTSPATPCHTTVLRCSLRRSELVVLP